jgi:adenosylmethionine---8-amino-7-oxononanoate aminotransferase
VTEVYTGDIPSWQQEGAPYIWMPYTQMQDAATPVPVVATDGVRLTLADGRQIIDGLASWWSACHGYNHPHILAEMEKQLRVMPHVMFGGINHEPALKLARRLATLLPDDLNHVFFADSGSVSVEVALKMAVQFWLNRGVHGKNRFVSFKYGYHGDTIGAMSVCDPENSMHAHFKGFLHEQFVTDLPQDNATVAALDDLLAINRDRIAAIVVEPLVQGAGGMRFHEPEVLEALRSLSEIHGVLLIFDEIATGFGRLGSMFACDQAGVVPDIITLSKAMTGGVMPLSAAVASDRIYEGFLSDDPTHALMHGPTYMANPLACAAANASLDLFEQEPRLEQAQAIEAQLKKELAPLQGLSHIDDVRAKGAVGAIQVDNLRDLDWLKRRFLEEGVWIRPFGDAIYVTPPLVVSEEDLRTLTTAMVNVVTEWSARAT